MSVTAYTHPGTAASVDTSTGPAWTNITNLQSGGEARNEVDGGVKSDTCKCSNFGFSLPANAVIDGIEMTMETESSGGYLEDATIQLSKSSGYVGDNKAQDYGDDWVPAPYGGQEEVYGGSTDLWGTTWTKAEVENSGFGVRVIVNNISSIIMHTALLDDLEIRIYYHIAATAPTVTTQAVSSVATTSVTGNGNITATGGANPTVRGFCYKEGTSGDPTTADDEVHDTGDYGTGAFSKSIPSLTKNTGYRVRAYATNSTGTSYGVTVQATTLSDPPTVTTQAVTNVAETTATGNGNITATGGVNATRRGFCYKVGTSGDPTTGDNEVHDTGDYGTGSFSKSIPGLSNYTSYRVRAYAINSAGTSYGATVQTKTLTAIPTVTTQALTNVKNTNATGNGNITATGGANATRRGFCYKAGTTGDPTTADSVAYDDGDYGTGAFTKQITGLTLTSSYRVRAYAVNPGGTSYGVSVQLTTTSAASGFVPRITWI